MKKQFNLRYVWVAVGVAATLCLSAFAYRFYWTARCWRARTSLYEQPIYTTRYLSPDVMYRYDDDEESGSIIVKDRGTTIDDVWWVATMPGDTTAVFCDGCQRGYFNVNTGLPLFDERFDLAWVFSEGIAAVQQGKSVHFIRPDGSQAFSGTFGGYDHFHDFVFHDGLCAVISDSTHLMGLIDNQGQWLLEPVYKNVKVEPERGILATDTCYVTRLLAMDGRTVINPTVILEVERLAYSNADDSECDASCFVYTCDRRHYGLMSDDGTFITKPVYENVTAMNAHLYLTYPDGTLINAY